MESTYASGGGAWSGDAAEQRQSAQAIPEFDLLTITIQDRSGWIKFLREWRNDKHRNQADYHPQ